MAEGEKYDKFSLPFPQRTFLGSSSPQTISRLSCVPQGPMTSSLMMREQKWSESPDQGNKEMEEPFLLSFPLSSGWIGTSRTYLKLCVQVPEWLHGAEPLARSDRDTCIQQKLAQMAPSQLSAQISVRPLTTPSGHSLAHQLILHIVVINFKVFCSLEYCLSHLKCKLLGGQNLSFLLLMLYPCCLE